MIWLELRLRYAYHGLARRLLWWIVFIYMDQTSRFFELIFGDGIHEEILATTRAYHASLCKGLWVHVWTTSTATVYRRYKRVVIVLRCFLVSSTLRALPPRELHLEAIHRGVHGLIQ